MLIRRLLIALFLLFPAKGFAADNTVAALAAASALAGSELFYCVQSSADKKCTASQISTFVLSNSVLAGVTPGTGVATALGVNIGTAGAVVVNGGALGTPSSGTLTSATGLPISTGISGLGTGVATFLATPTSANFAAAVTGETGTGAVVFGTNPTIDAPTVTNSAAMASATFSGAVSFTATVNCSTGPCMSQSTGNAFLLGGGTSGFVFNNNAGNSNIMTLSNAGVLSVPFLTQTSAAQTGTVCWATGGTLTVDTTVGCLTSSARFKHDIQPLRNSLATTLALKPVSYEYNEMVKGEQVGFIAEDVATVDDRLVSRDPDGSPHAVRYQQLTAILAGAIQQLKADNDNLRIRLEHLEMRR